jgi:hypothetical protein
VTPGTLVVPHRYQNGQYVAEGEVDTVAVDPDGDPMAAAGVLSPAPPAGCTEEVSPGAGGKLHVRVICSLADALVGAEPRTLTVAVVDANGGSITFTAPLEIGNRPPELALHPDFAGVYALDHRVDRCVGAENRSCFVAESGDPFVATDPDGDPLQGYALTGRVDAGYASSTAFSVVGAASRLRYETPTTAPADFRRPDGTSGFSAAAMISDSLGATATLTAPLLVRNRPPIVREAVPSAQVDHVYDAATRRYRASVPGPAFEDPDGDPVEIGVSRGGFCRTPTVVDGRVTIGCDSMWDYSLGGRPPFSTTAFSGPTDVVASDGWEAVVSTTEVTILDRPATVSAPSTVIESCVCWIMPNAASGIWTVGWSNIALPLMLNDPDGDPAQITVKAVGYDASAPTVGTYLPGWLTNTFTSPTETAEVYLTTTPAEPWLALQVTVTPTCSRLNQRCY